MEIGREIFWNVGGGARWLTYALMVITLIVLYVGLKKRYSMWKFAKGKCAPFDFSKRLWERIGYFIENGIFHKSIMRESFPGTMHFFIFWGFLILAIGTALVAFQDDIVRPFFKANILQGGFYLIFSAVLDAAGLVAIIGIVMAIWRRYVTKPSRLDNKTDDAITLVWILVVLITNFLNIVNNNNRT